MQETINRFKRLFTPIQQSRPSLVVQEDIPSVLKGIDALKAAGIQHEFAAQLVIQCASLSENQFIILRCGNPPVAHQLRGPKGPWNLTKTSTQCLWERSITVDQRFSRLSDGEGRKLDPKDATNLTLPLTHPEHQYAKVLTVTLQDILAHISPESDMVVIGYENGLLRLACKSGTVDKKFHGQIVINLMEGKESSILYSRPWEKPDHQPMKPSELSMVLDDIYTAATNKLFKVYFTEEQDPIADNSLLQELKVFANTPKNSLELIAAIKTSGVLKEGDPDDQEKIAELSHMDEQTPLWFILHLLTPAQINTVYDKVGLIVTGDWDGLALPQPVDGLLDGFPPEKMRVYDVKKFRMEMDYHELRDLETACCDLFHFLKTHKRIASTSLGKMLGQIDDPRTIFNQLSLTNVGSVTPYECFFIMMINYSGRLKANSFYGEREDMPRLQACIDIGLQTYQNLKENPDCAMTEVDLFHRCVRASLDYNAKITSLRQEALSVELGMSATKNGIKPSVVESEKGGLADAKNQKYTDYIERHLRIAIDEGQCVYQAPHPAYDPNMQDKMQHGFDNQYQGANLDGPSLLVTARSEFFYTTGEKALTSLMLEANLLANAFLRVPPAANMSAGWGEIIRRQEAFGHLTNPAVCAVNFRPERPPRKTHRLLWETLGGSSSETTSLASSTSCSDQSSDMDPEIALDSDPDLDPIPDASPDSLSPTDRLATPVVMTRKLREKKGIALSSHFFLGVNIPPTTPLGEVKQRPFPLFESKF